MASGALFPSMVSGSRGSSSKYLVEFRAGKMTMKGSTVTPDKRKGQVYIQQTDDSLIHFCWKDRTTGNVDDVSEQPVKVWFSDLNLAFLSNPVTLSRTWLSSPMTASSNGWISAQRAECMCWSLKLDPKDSFSGCRCAPILHKWYHIFLFCFTGTELKSTKMLCFYQTLFCTHLKSVYKCHKLHTGCNNHFSHRTACTPVSAVQETPTF